MGPTRKVRVDGAFVARVNTGFDLNDVRLGTLVQRCDFGHFICSAK